jgi:WD40 repeat protein
LLDQTKTIYPITCSTASIDLTLLALGLKDGTVQIWDINNGVLKYNFDKHPAPVKCLSFF